MGGADPFALPIESVPTGELVAGAVALGVVLIVCWFLFGLLRLALKLLFGVVVTFLIAATVLSVCYAVLVVMGTIRAYVPTTALGISTLVLGVAFAAALGLFYFYRRGVGFRRCAWRPQGSGTSPCRV